MDADGANPSNSRGSALPILGALILGVAAAAAYGAIAFVLVVALSIDALGTTGDTTTPAWFLIVVAAGLLGAVAVGAAAATWTLNRAAGFRRGPIVRVLVVAGSGAVGVLSGMWAGFVLGFNAPASARLPVFFACAVAGAALGVTVVLRGFRRSAADVRSAAVPPNKRIQLTARR